ncbi:MAG: hypothetical protein PHV34_21660 [Verrucomicrobiae bacterium]|nr:hypothetical protein [Verrucomicrobiae bacterium]
MPVVFGEAVQCAQRTAAFDCQNPSNQIGFFEPSTNLEIEEYVADAKMFRVCFKAPNGSEVRALCRPEALGKTAPGTEPAATTAGASSSAAAGKPSAAAAPGNEKTEVDLLLVRGSVQKTVSSATGQFDIPTGPYEVRSYRVRKLVNGRKWAIMGFSLPDKYRKVEGSGQPFTLQLGEGLVLRPQVKIKDKVASINCWLVGALNESYRMAVEESGKFHAAPKFQLVDEGGKVLGNGQFEFG